MFAAAVKPRADIPDDQWEAAKKDGISGVHEALGIGRPRAQEERRRGSGVQARAGFAEPGSGDDATADFALQHDGQARRSDCALRSAPCHAGFAPDDQAVRDTGERQGGQGKGRCKVRDR